MLCTALKFAPAQQMGGVWTQAAAAVASNLDTL